MRLSGVILMVGLLVFSTAAAADPVTVRSDVQPGYGRLTFVWPAPVTHTSQLEDGVLTLTFARPIEADWTAVSQGFAGYVSGALISADGRTVRLQLTKHFLFRSYETETVVTVDLLGAGTRAAPQAPAPAPAPAAQAAAQPPAAAAQPPAPAAPVAAVAAVRVRIGQHEGYGRIVFDWTQDVEYTAVREGNAVVIDFSRGTPIDLSIFNRDSLAQVAGVSARAADGRAVVSAEVAPGSRLRHFRSGTSVVVDILDSAQAENAPQQAAAQPAAAQPAAPQVAVTDPQVAAPEPGAPEQPAPEIAVAAAAAVVAPQVGLAAGVGAAAGAFQPGPQGANLGLQVTYSLPEDGPPRIGLVTSRPVALAAFMRAGYLWAVLDGVAAGGGMADIPEALAETVFMAERIGHNTVTAVRFRLADGVFPAINLNADGWTIDLDLEPAALNQPIDLVRQNTADLGPVLILPVTQAGALVEILDPEVGDSLYVVMVGVPRHGVADARSFLQFRLLETSQGVAVQKQDDRVEFVEFPNGVAITGTEALFLTPVPDGTVLGAGGAEGVRRRACRRRTQF